MFINGTQVYPYIITLHNSIPIIGFDTQPIGVITERWLKAVRVTQERAVKIQREATRAGILNEAAARKLIEGDEFKGPVELKVESETLITTDEDSLFRLDGIPSMGDYGALRLLPPAVLGIAYADHKDLAKQRAFVRVAPDDTDYTD